MGDVNSCRLLKEYNFMMQKLVQMNDTKLFADIEKPVVCVPPMELTEEQQRSLEEVVVKLKEYYSAYIRLLVVQCGRDYEESEVDKDTQKRLFEVMERKKVVVENLRLSNDKMGREVASLEKEVKEVNESIEKLEFLKKNLEEKMEGLERSIKRCEDNNFENEIFFTSECDFMRAMNYRYGKVYRNSETNNLIVEVESKKREKIYVEVGEVNEGVEIVAIYLQNKRVTKQCLEASNVSFGEFMYSIL